MPYIGKSPEHGNFSELNDVSGSFNGSTTQFALTTRIGGIAITPVVESALLISLDGVIQESTTDYTVSGTNITFTTAPASTVSFFGVVMGRQLDVGTPSDGTITQAKLASTFMTGASDIGGAIADADLFFIDDGAGGTLRKTAASRLKTYIGTDFSDPGSADGDTLGSASLEWSDLYLADGGIIYLGNDQDVTLTHVADTGVLLNSSRKIQFGDSATFIHQSSDGVMTVDGEATIDLNASTAVLVSNDLKLNSDSAVLGFGADNDVTVTHVADTGLTVKNAHTSGNSGIGAVLTLQTGDTDMADGNVMGHIKFQAPDEGQGTDAILVGAGILAEAEGDFSSSSNATAMVFQTASSETAAEKMRLDSNGDLGIGVANPTRQLHIAKSAAADIVALTDGATITPDFAAGQNFSVTLAGNRTLANPTNIVAGQGGSIFITQDGTGSRTLAYGTYWDFAGGTAPTMTTTASKVDRLDYVVVTATDIHAVATLDLS